MIHGTVAGRIVRNAELRFIGDGTAVLGFTVAADVGYGDKKHAVFTKCSLWGNRGAGVAAYVLKGVPVTVIGSLDLREWESKDGKTGKDLEMNVLELVLQGSKSGAPAAPQDAPKPSDNGFRQEQQPPPAVDNDFADSDIPF